MRRLICHFWDEAQMVCRASGNYCVPFKAVRGVTQGGPLSAKLFNLLVDAFTWVVIGRLRRTMGKRNLPNWCEGSSQSFM